MPQRTEDILRVIRSDNAKAISDMLWDLINQHKTREGRIALQAHQRYRQDRDGVPVYSKFYADYEKAHEKIPNDFYGDIVDLKTGYMGNEIVIGIDKKKIGENEMQREIDFLDRFSLEQSTTDQNSELVRTSAKAGKAYRLLYVDAEADARILNTEPWETVIYRDASLQKPQAAMRYFHMAEASFGGDLTYPAPDERKNAPEQKLYRVEWYDDREITYYRQTKSGPFVLDTSKPENGVTRGTGRQPHFFDGVPIIDFPNNEEGQAEPFKALELIDAYDDIISDSASEVEQFRMAYMWAKGAGLKLNAEFERMVEQTGVFPLPETGEIGFVSKDLGGASEFVQYVLGEIRRNIYSFSKSVDLSQDRGGNMRVIGWQLAMLRMEMSAQVTERKFRRSYMQQYRLLTDFWRNRKQINIDPLNLRYTFTRKFPKDVDQEIDTLVKGIEVLPLETIYGLMSFINNPAELAEKFKKERPEMETILGNLEDAESQLG